MTDKNAEDKNRRRREPGPAKQVGDESPNPLPDEPTEGDYESGSDQGRA